MTGRGRAGGGGGGGGEVEFLTEKKCPLRNVPGVLKRQKKFGGGGRKISKFFFPTKFKKKKMFLGFLLL